MSPDELKRVLHHLHDGPSGFALPYSCTPLTYEPLTEELWEDVQWNPAQGQAGHTEPDPRASPKPSWGRLQLTLRALNAQKEIVSAVLNEACEVAIIAAYAARDRQHETQKRLAGETTPAQDAERVRLIARCHAVEAEIEAAGTLTKREAILAKIGDGSWARGP